METYRPAFRYIAVRALAPLLLLAVLQMLQFTVSAAGQETRYYPVKANSHPHDVAPAPDGAVWFTAQASGALGRLDPGTGTSEYVPLGGGSSPHGVIMGPDGAAWVTDGGLNAIVRVDRLSRAVRTFPLPAGRENANLNTAVFGKGGILWFTGQSGVYGRLDPKSGHIDVFDAPKGQGPYGITVTPGGDVYFASLAGSYIARIDPATGKAAVIGPLTPGQGARRVWSDSRGRVWVSEWNTGQVSVYDPPAGAWRSWKLPGRSPRAYAVYVDDHDDVWLSDFGANAIVRFDSRSETFTSFPSDRASAQVRQLNGRKGEVWGAESAQDRLVVIRSKGQR